MRDHTASEEWRNSLGKAGPPVNSRSTVVTVTDTSFDCRSRPSPSTCEYCERLGSWNNELKRSGAYID